MFCIDFSRGNTELPQDITRSDTKYTTYVKKRQPRYIIITGSAAAAGFLTRLLSPWLTESLAEYIREAAVSLFQSAGG